MNEGSEDVNIRQVERIKSSAAKPDVEPVVEPAVGKIFVDDPKLSMRELNVFYGDTQAIFDVSLDIARNEILALILSLIHI